MRVLTRRTLCADCHEIMGAGEPFRWVEKRIAVGKRGTGYRAVWRTAHADTLCWHKKMQRDELRQEISGCEKAIKQMDELQAPQMVIEIFTARAAEARAKLAAIV